MGQNKQSVKTFFINNYHYIALILFFLTNLLIIFRLGIATDDLWFRKVSVCSPSVMLRYFQWHYHKENGRLLAHILTVLFLRNKATFVIWKTLTVFSLFAYCIIISKLSAKNRSRYNRISFYDRNNGYIYRLRILAYRLFQLFFPCSFAVEHYASHGQKAAIISSSYPLAFLRSFNGADRTYDDRLVCFSYCR